MVKGGIITVIACILSLLVTPLCFAEEATCMTKLGNGLNNILTGWMEIPKQIQEVTTEQDDPIAGLTYGLAKGVGRTLARALTGLFDVVTCPFAPYDEPMMEPIFKFGE